MTAIREVPASVERVERPEPSQPKGAFVLYVSPYHPSWQCDHGGPLLREDAIEHELKVNRETYGPDSSHAVVRIGAPLPSPTSDEIDQLLVNLHNRIEELAMHNYDEERRDALRALSALSEKLGRVTR